MEDRIKQCIAMLREGACCSVCVNAFPSVDWPYPCEERIATNNNMDEAANIIESLVVQLEAAQPKWSSVEERLPEESGSYLVCTRRSYAFTAHFYLNTNEWKSHFAGSAGKHITHWMPLPPSPKEEV